MENVGIFYGHLEYFTAILCNLLPYCIGCGHLVKFSNLVCLDQEKSGNPGSGIPFPAVFRYWQVGTGKQGIPLISPPYH
jgi:hypothetical protein